MTEPTEEKQGDLEDQMRRGKKLEGLTECDGWADLLLPHIQGGKRGALNSLLAATLPEEMARHQQAFKTLDAIEKFVTNNIELGKEARKALFPQEDRG